MPLWRTAVDEQKQRVLLGFIESGRIMHPHLDVLTIGSGVGYAFVGAEDLPPPRIFVVNGVAGCGWWRRCVC